MKKVLCYQVENGGIIYTTTENKKQALKVFKELQKEGNTKNNTKEKINLRALIILKTK